MFIIDPRNMKKFKRNMQRTLAAYARAGYLVLTATHIPAYNHPGAILAILAETKAMGLDDEDELETKSPGDNGGIDNSSNDTVELESEDSPDEMAEAILEEMKREHKNADLPEPEIID